MRFRQQKANAGPVTLAHKGLPLPHCMQDILPSNLRKNFSYLALLAMQHYRLAFQNSFSVWTTYDTPMKKEVMRRVKRSKKKPKPIQQSLASAQEPDLLLA